MGKSWDKGIPYDWCLPRAKEILRILKPGGYCLIFGHPKTNHRMKCAFEDAGFNIVDEIDWIYLTGMPKNQDIGKMFDKKARGCPQGTSDPKSKMHGKWNSGCTEDNLDGRNYGAGASQWGEIGINDRYMPESELAIQWDGWKTAGLKPAHEPITIFQKPIEKNYCYNIEKWNCGGMNIDACRVPYDGTEDPRTHGGDWSTKSAAKNVYSGGYAGERLGVSQEGRFPPNIILNEFTAQILDEQTGNRPSGKGNGNAKIGEESEGVTPLRRGKLVSRNDTGGGSRMFPIMKYCTKVSSKEKLLSDGIKNHHVTVKPKELIKWLIKLVTPKNGITIDITAGSCTHGVACEELNRDEGYNLKWCNIEFDEDDKGNSLGYIDFGNKRLQDIANT